jgi:hypothetical protein
MRRFLSAFAISLAIPIFLSAEVSRVEITSRHDVPGNHPYEYMTGRIYFTVDPANRRNGVITDLDRAPRNSNGQVEFSADVAILKPRDSRGNDVALVDIVNRGRKTVMGSFNRAAASANFTTPQEIGNGLLMREGFTVVWVGWEFDVPRGEGLMRIEVPGAMETTGLVRAVFTPSYRGDSYTVGDLMGYLPEDSAAAENSLGVREHFGGAVIPIPRDRWSLAGNVVTLTDGFEPGRTYELAYRASNPPIAGLGLAAVRDTAAWIKYRPDSLASSKYAMTFGSSQSGRFLREFLYYGFNSDEKERQVFDGVMAHIAGSGRIELNRRWSTPTSLLMYAATSFPFANMKLKDPVTGAEDGLIENSRAAEHPPKIFFTNTGVEYWGGGRVAALIHTAPDGSKDLKLPDNERVYFLSGSQHSPSRFPSSVTAGQQRDNSNDYWWTMRALLVAMEKWILNGTKPPESRYPRLEDGTLVRAVEVAFPNLPDVTSPQGLTGGGRAANSLLPHNAAPGTPLPLLVPQVDKDGNEPAGIRLPEVAVPLATYTGWNFRNAEIGGTDQLFPLLGSYIPFAATKAQREAAHDPRFSIEERYASRDRYLKLVQETGDKLVKDRYLLPEDLPGLVRRAAEHWDLLVRSSN